MPVPVIVVAGTASGVGKTSVATGLMAALRAKGLRVQAFKVGPDFLDPMYHELATGSPSLNLDGWMLTREAVCATFARGAARADIAVVEGVMGLFDGLDGATEAGSTAQLAKWLRAPVLLVLDCSAAARSLAATVRGFRDFDPGVDLAGLVLNRVAGAAHARWLRDALAAGGLAELAVLGGLPSVPSVALPERNLGLQVPGEDPGGAAAAVEALGALMASHLDLDALVDLAARAGSGKDGPARALIGPPPAPPLPYRLSEEEREAPVRIAVARDEAFCFYYHENLALLEAAGAELVYFSALHEPLPGGVAGVYLGGGYPELHAQELSKNTALRAGLKAFSAAGGVIYAECGGLIFLSRAVQPEEHGGDFPMVGVFGFKTVLTHRMTMGYVEVETTKNSVLMAPGRTARGQVFHYTEIVEEHVVASVAQHKGDAGAAWVSTYTARPQFPGAEEVVEGFSVRNTLASYIHLHFGSCPELASDLVAACRAADVATLHAAAVGAARAALAAATMPAVPSRGSMYGVRSSNDLMGMGDDRRQMSYEIPAGMMPHVGHSDLAEGRAASITPPPVGRTITIYPAAGIPRAASSTGLDHNECFAGQTPPTLSPRDPGSLDLQPQRGAAPGRAGAGWARGGAAAPRGGQHSASAASLLAAGPGQGQGGMSRSASHAALLSRSPSQPALGLVLPPGRPAGGAGPAAPHARRGSEDAGGPGRATPGATPTARSSMAGGLSEAGGALTWQPNDRIVSLGPGASEVLWALGLGARVVAVSDACDWPAEAAGRPRAARRLATGARAAAQRGDVEGAGGGRHRRPRAGLPDLQPLALRVAELGAAVAARLGVGGPHGGTRRGGGAVPRSSSTPGRAVPGSDAAPAPTLAARLSLYVDERMLARERPGLVVVEDEGDAAEALCDALVAVGLQAGTAVVCLRRRCLADVLEAMLEVGAAAGVAEEAARVVDRLRARLRSAASLRAPLRALGGGTLGGAGAGNATPHPPRILILRSASPALPAAGPWIPEMAALVGGASAAQHADGARALSAAELAAGAPGILVVLHGPGAGGLQAALAGLAEAAGSGAWWQLPAARAGEVYLAPAPLFSRPGPRLADGVALLARALHGGAAPPLPMPVLKLALRPGQRCRPPLLSNYFLPWS
uniref:Uncharacterized protein n=1 Tax=Auxenochlorella protothecoides TaxID=3075 RepID=A0A1D2AEZ8_AUXPR